MTSVVRKSYTLLRVYSGIRRTFILQNGMNKKLQPFTARNIFKTSEHQASENEEKAVGFHGFTSVKTKEKQTYLQVLRIFVNRDINRRGHVEFIYAAMKHMEEFGVNKDLDAYKRLFEVLPKGKFVSENILQAEFMHYPKQQQCAIDLLEQMENNGVIPDREMGDIILTTFGSLGYPIRKFWRMMYWMPKFKNASPWPLPDVLPNDSLELAKLAIDRITSVDICRKVSVFNAKELPDSIDNTWIVSGISPAQESLLAKHPEDTPIYVEGPFRLWLMHVSINYFILRADPVKRAQPVYVDDDGRNPSLTDVSKIELPFWNETAVVKKDSRTVHEQEDATILAVCATGTSSRDSLLSWIRFLEKDNATLSKIPVLFTLKSPVGAAALTADDKSGGLEDPPEDEKKIENK